MIPRRPLLLPLVFSLLTLLLLIARWAPAQSIHTEAAEAYWHLTDALRHDEPLTDAAWQQLLALPDNRVYVNAVWGSDTADLRLYRRAVEVVYRPRYDSLRRAKVQANSWYYVLVNQYREHEADDRAFLAAVAKNPGYLDNMYTYAQAFLPARNHTKVTDLRLAYVALGNDATSQAEGIVFSVRDARNYQAFPDRLEAHEMHHQLRTGKDFGQQDPADQGILWAASAAQNEGLADLVDKRVLLEQTADTATANELRRWLLAPAPAVLQKIDSTLQVQAAGGPATPRRFYKRLTNGSNGHLPGFFMAYTILQNGYGKPLLAHADDPLAFVLLYQRAATRDRLHRHPPTFSPAAVRYLRHLARKYAKPRQTTA